jgi:hypothetical protein
VADRSPAAPQAPPPGAEPLTADLSAELPGRRPRLSTRALVVTALALVVLLVASTVVAVVLLHQPRLTPVPVPSVSAIA